MRRIYTDLYRPHRRSARRVPYRYPSIKGAPVGRGAVSNTMSSLGEARRGEGVGHVCGAPGGCESMVTTARIATSKTSYFTTGPYPPGTPIPPHDRLAPRLASPRLDTVLLTAPRPPGAPIGEICGNPSHPCLALCAMIKSVCPYPSKLRQEAAVRCGI